MSRFKLLNKGLSANMLYGKSDKKPKSYKRAVICIQKKDKIYKILSISSSKDESINVFFPYCKEKEAYVMQFKHTYKAGEQKIRKGDIVKEFIIDKNSKLSIHKSGFVHLSGKGILSGIDEKTGKPKGIGVFSSPLDNPVRSGPTFGFQCWGLENGFELLSKQKNSDQYIILDKDRNDFTKRKWFKKDIALNTYLLEFFIFPKEANEFIYEYKDNPFIDHEIDNYSHDSGARFAHPVLDLKYFSGVVCVFPVLVWTQFPDESKCGFITGSPGGSEYEDDKLKTGYNFTLVCPRKETFQMSESNLEKLEY